MPNGIFHLHSLGRSISDISGVWLGFIITMFYRKACYLNANTVDPDQTPRSAASDRGLHCLPVFFFLDARLKWVKKKEEDSLSEAAWRAVKQKGNQESCFPWRK